MKVIRIVSNSYFHFTNKYNIINLWIFYFLFPTFYGIIFSHLLMNLFLCSDTKFKKIVNPTTAEAEYDFAAKLGLTSRNQIICQQRYASCPYTSEELMNALRNSHI